MTITSIDRSMISKLLGLIGSDHDGEALAAARKAHEMVKSKGVTWPEILGLDANPEPPPEPDHIAVARDLLGRGKGICTRWEMDFLRGVLAFKTLSSQQLQSLDGIREKVDATAIDT